MFGKKASEGGSTGQAHKPAAPAPAAVAPKPAPPKPSAPADVKPPPPVASSSPQISSEQMAQLKALSSETGKGPAKSAAESKKASGEEILALGGHAEAEVKVSGSDSMTSLRLQRARNRIWLDLRDGIDLKALARMDGKAAREEVASAVQEIARFRNLDITPAELELPCD